MHETCCYIYFRGNISNDVFFSKCNKTIDKRDNSYEQKDILPVSKYHSLKSAQNAIFSLFLEKSFAFVGKKSTIVFCSI